VPTWVMPSWIMPTWVLSFGTVRLVLMELIQMITEILVWTIS